MSDQPVIPAPVEPVAPVAEDRKHHPYSPSTLQNLEWCPCYRGKQAKVEHERTTAGTRAHGVVETGEDDNRLSDEDTMAAAECLDFVARHAQIMQEEADRARAEARYDGQHAKPEFFKVTELKEVKLAVDDLKFPDADCTTSGYVDRVLLNWDKTHAEMFDWKFGKWPVESAANNLQGIAYVLGLFRMYPSLLSVRLFFKQPHLDYTSEALFNRDQIPELYLRVQTVVARAREARSKGDFSMARPGVPVCNFCAELGRCDKVCAFACKVARKFHPVEIPENITPSLINSPDQTALGLRLAAVLKVWCDAFRSQVTERVIRGDAPMPAGQKVQEMQKRELLDMAKLKTAALKYLTESEFQTTLECTFGSVEDLISEKAPRGHKKNTVEEFKQLLLDTGAVKLGDKFSFLRAIPVKD
jgi:hypothetical protein